MSKDVDTVQKELWQKSIDLGVLDALIVIATHEPETCDGVKTATAKYTQKWEKCLITLERDELDRRSYTLAPTKNPTVAEIKFDDGSKNLVIYKSDGSAFRMGAWVERFITYANEIKAQRKAKRLEKTEQLKAKKLEPFQEIDF